MLEQASQRWAQSKLTVHEGPYWLLSAPNSQLARLGTAFGRLGNDIGALVTGVHAATVLLPQRLWRPGVQGLEVEGFSGPYSVVEIRTDATAAAEAGFLAPAIARLALADIAVQTFTTASGFYLAARSDDSPQVVKIISLLIEECLARNSGKGDAGG